MSNAVLKTCSVCGKEAHAGGLCPECWANTETGRKLVQQQYPGVDEFEAIAYARGFTRGLKYCGMSEEHMKTALVVAAFNDALLGAGVSFMTLNILESLAKEKH